MSTSSVRGRQVVDAQPLLIPIQTEEYRSRPIPGLGKRAKIGECFVRVTDLPADLGGFMRVNPRTPKPARDGRLAGSVVAGIRETLTESPEQMAIKSIGIFVLVDEATFGREQGGMGVVTLRLTDLDRHGIVNGGHTFLTIREVIEESEDDELERLAEAYVPLHIYQGIGPDQIPLMADGLNRSKQVDDPSLDNLRKLFDSIKKVMDGEPGEEAISYHQGGEGPIYITEVLAALELFNCERFSESEHPSRLFSSNKLPVRYYEEDAAADPSPLDLLVPYLPEILRLSDRIRELTPAAAKRVGFEFGRAKVGGKQKARAGNSANRNIPLPFLGKTMDYRVPKGWVLPMLSAFRANVTWDLAKRKFAWKVAPEKLLTSVIDDMVRVCVRVHVENKSRPEFVGKTESAYAQCYDKVQIQLAKLGKL
jgi:hypothetical protein